MTSKAAARKAEAEAYTSRVKDALARSHEAAAKAVAEYIKTEKRDQQGFVAGVCGGGYIKLYKPSYRLRETLKALGKIDSSYRGGWALSGYTNDIFSHGAGQDYMANHIACNAACEVLAKELAGEGNFYPHSYID